MPLPPLSPHVPIVDSAGRPTPEFLQWWQNQRDINDEVVPLGTGNEVSDVLDNIGATQGSILYRDSSNWNALGPGTAGRFLQTQGAGANPQWAAGSGAFTDLSDVPSSYSGEAGNVVAVNATEDGLEFIAPGGGGGSSGLPWADYAPVTDATSWTSVSTINPRTDGDATMYEDDTYGYIGYEYRSTTTSNVMLESPTKGPSAGNDFDLVFRVNIFKGRTRFEFMGVYVRNTSNSRILTFGLFTNNNRFQYQYWNGTTFISEIDVSRGHYEVDTFKGYLRMRRVGSDITLYSSLDGIAWVTHITVAVATYIGDADACGLFQRAEIGSYSTIMLWGLNDDGPQTPA